MRLLRESKFISSQGWTLIIEKIKGRKAFLVNPKYQYSVSKCGEQDCSANNKKNGDCYEHPGLSHFTNEL